MIDDRLDRTAELTHDHPRLAIGDQGELIALLADDRTDRCRLEHAVHLVACVRERVLDDVEGDVVDVVVPHEVGKGTGFGLLGDAHRASLAEMMMFAYSSTAPA